MVDEVYKIIENVSSFYKKRVKEKYDRIPAEEHTLVYDSSSETLEPVYFWILDFASKFADGGKIEKLVDTFTSSPGSGHFSELMGKATNMRDEGMKIMQTVGLLIKSLINIVYDLRQFELRFHDYDTARSKNKDEARAGLLALKQIWLDNVDIKKGNTSIKAMTFSQSAFATLIDAFMIVGHLEKIKEMDLNDRVKRILWQRLNEFNIWRDLSEKELRKRYNIQKTWLKSQVQALRLYTRWARPYLKAAEDLGMKDDKDAALVNAFNTMRMDLAILVKKKIDVEQSILSKDFPEKFRYITKKKDYRDYYACVLIDFKFRGIPMRNQQGHYVFGGRVEVNFRAYCLNEDELDLMYDKLEESDLNLALNLVQGATEESLGEIREDIEYFLKEQSERVLGLPNQSQQEQEKNEDVNPFFALLGLGGKKKSKKTEKKDMTSEEKEKAEKEEKIKKLKEKGIRKDDYIEAMIRTVLGEPQAGENCYTIFDVYKKGHGMASHIPPEEYGGEKRKERGFFE